MILADTSVLVDFFRGTDSAGARRLRAIELADEPFAIPTICCQELLQGARDEGEWRVLREYLETQRHVDAADPWATHAAAARIWFDCRRRGTTPRSTVDCWIAQLVLDTPGGSLLHNDVDFERIAAVRPLKMAL